MGPTGGEWKACMNFLRKNKNTKQPSRQLLTQAFWNQPALLSLLIGLGLTAYFYAQAYRLESSSVAAEVKSYTRDIGRELESDLLNHLNTLRALRSFFAASQKVEAPGFGIFAEHILNLHPAIETLEWVPRVLSEDATAFKTAARRPGASKISIYKLNEAGVPANPGKKKEFYPTLFVEPLETSAAAIGFDHSSDEERRTAMLHAAEIDDIFITGVLDIPRWERSGEAAVRGFVAYLPVFASDASRRHSPRPSQLLKGYLTAAFHANDLVRASVKKFTAAHTTIRVYMADPAAENTWIEILETGDAETAERPAAGSRSGVGLKTRVTQRTEFSVSGGRWAVVCDREGNPYGTSHRISSALLLVGILISALLALTLVMVERRKFQELVTEWSVRDELTGLYNRRGFLLFAEERMRLSQRNRSGLWLVCADLDYLKRINDTYGHAEGDKVLARAGKILKDAFRDSDIVARVGGDEFAALVVESDENGREAILDRIRAKVLEAAEGPVDRRVSLSVGAVYARPEEPTTLDALFRRADEDLYRAKASRPPVPAAG